MIKCNWCEEILANKFRRSEHDGEFYHYDCFDWASKKISKIKFDTSHQLNIENKALEWKEEWQEIYRDGYLMLKEKDGSYTLFEKESGNRYE